MLFSLQTALSEERVSLARGARLRFVTAAAGGWASAAGWEDPVSSSSDGSTPSLHAPRGLASVLCVWPLGTHLLKARLFSTSPSFFGMYSAQGHLTSGEATPRPVCWGVCASILDGAGLSSPLPIGLGWLKQADDDSQGHTWGDGLALHTAE